MTTWAEKMLIFNSEGIGGGEPGLSRKMMKGFIKMLVKQPVKPHTLFFLGDSIKLLVNGSPILEFLEELVQEGVEVLACRAAVEWYALEFELVVGKISSTGSLLQRMAELEVITL
ncbi:MAG: hypothetical protein ACYCVD_05950 [Desulfitobacteriaceae bacterium]